MQLRVAACQILTYPGVAESRDKIIHWLEKAHAEGVDVVAFPEAGLCGYQVDPDYWAKADPQAFINAESVIVDRV